MGRNRYITKGGGDARFEEKRYLCVTRGNWGRFFPIFALRNIIMALYLSYMYSDAHMRVVYAL